MKIKSAFYIQGKKFGQDSNRSMAAGRSPAVFVVGNEMERTIVILADPPVNG